MPRVVRMRDGRVEHDDVRGVSPANAAAAEAPPA
jgi:hypothetical protein